MREVPGFANCIKEWIRDNQELVSLKGIGVGKVPEAVCERIDLL
jgi:hypothetical protein